MACGRFPPASGSISSMGLFLGLNKSAPRPGAEPSPRARQVTVQGSGFVSLQLAALEVVALVPGRPAMGGAKRVISGRKGVGGRAAGFKGWLGGVG